MSKSVLWAELSGVALRSHTLQLTQPHPSLGFRTPVPGHAALRYGKSPVRDWVSQPRVTSSA
jgi:hypothetical protein